MKTYSGKIIKNALSHWTDYTGIAASVLCFVHCWALPVIILFLPGVMIHNELVHPVLGGVAVLSTFPLFWKKSLKNLEKPIIAAMIMGNLLLLTLLLSHDHLSFTNELLLSTAGGSLLVFVHYRHLNVRKHIHIKSFSVPGEDS
ncbi:MAG: MerC domain-containing protein [Candidatus Cyclobacteriaceae bacterium M3_2C_046]